MFNDIISMFESPESRVCRLKREAEYAKRLCRDAVEWDFQKMKKPRANFAIQHAAYITYINSFVPMPSPAKDAESPIDPDTDSYIERGDWRYRKSVLTCGKGLTFPVKPYDDHPPSVYFTGDVAMHMLQQRRGRLGQWCTWMGLTPAEMLSQRSGIRFCRDTAVIGGLGLGWFAWEAAKRKQVKRLIVVEKNRELIDWFGADLCKSIGAEIIHDDVWNVVEKMPNDTRFALDIWPGWWDARYDRKLAQHRRDGKQIWAWGSARGGTDL